MTTPDTTADKLALLFSTDWFRPHWSLTGFVPREGVSTEFQNHVRDLVGKMMSDAETYWLVDFSAYRVKHTQDAILGLFHRYSSDDSKLGLLRAMVIGADNSEALTDVSMTL